MDQVDQGGLSGLVVLLELEVLVDLVVLEALMVFCVQLVHTLCSIGPNTDTTRACVPVADSLPPRCQVQASDIAAADNPVFV